MTLHNYFVDGCPINILNIFSISNRFSVDFLEALFNNALTQQIYFNLEKSLYKETALLMTSITPDDNIVLGNGMFSPKETADLRILHYEEDMDILYKNSEGGSTVINETYFSHGSYI
jgi:hypothetical protein